MTPHTPGNLHATTTPTSPTPLSFRPGSGAILPSSNHQRAIKSKLTAAITPITPQKDTSIFAPTPSTSFNPDPSVDGSTTIPSPVDIYPPPISTISTTDIPISDFSTGMKRPRHAAMMLDSTSGLPSGTGTGRRRTRSHRNINAIQDQNQSQVGEEMDVEEEGRERKRVARR